MKIITEILDTISSLKKQTQHLTTQLNSLQYEKDIAVDGYINKLKKLNMHYLDLNNELTKNVSSLSLAYKNVEFLKDKRLKK
jgi:hypothetical protein